MTPLSTWTTTEFNIFTYYISFNLFYFVFLLLGAGSGNTTSNDNTQIYQEDSGV